MSTRRITNANRRARGGMSTGGSEALYPFTLLPSIWWRGDDPAANIVAATYNSIPNRGTLGGSIGTGGSQPAVVTVSAKNSPDFSASGGALVVPGGAAVALPELSMPATTASIAMRAVFDTASVTDGTVFRNRSTAVGTRGIVLRKTSTNTLRLTVGNGTTDTLDLTGGAASITTGNFTIVLVKTLLQYDLYVNGALYVTGSASSLDTGNPAANMSFGAGSGGTAGIDGKIPEVFYMPTSAMDGTQRTAIGTYLDRWN